MLYDKTEVTSSPLDTVTVEVILLCISWYLVLHKYITINIEYKLLYYDKYQNIYFYFRVVNLYYIKLQKFYLYGDAGD